MINRIFLRGLSFLICVTLLAASQDSNKLEIFMSSDKEVYAVSEPILISLKIKNISLDKLSIFTRYLKSPNYLLQEGILQIVNSKGKRIPCGLPMQPLVQRASEYIVLTPGEEKEYEFDIYDYSSVLEPETYTITYFYYGSDSYYENEVLKKVEFPFHEKIKSNSLLITIKR
jgi:hypothetical protein